MISNSFKQNQIHIFFQEYSSKLFLESILVIENYSNWGERMGERERVMERARESKQASGRK